MITVNDVITVVPWWFDKIDVQHPGQAVPGRSPGMSGWRACQDREGIPGLQIDRECTLAVLRAASWELGMGHGQCFESQVKDMRLWGKLGCWQHPAWRRLKATRCVRLFNSCNQWASLGQENIGAVALPIQAACVHAEMNGSNKVLAVYLVQYTAVTQLFNTFCGVLRRGQTLHAGKGKA